MASEGEYVQRFTLSERIIHVLLFSSLIVLSITGLTLKYHESGFAQWIIGLEGGVLFRGKIHRFAALILMGTFAYHILAVILSKRAHTFSHDMIFDKKDFEGFVAIFKYNLGLRKEMPAFGRFTCIEKFQYWATGIAVILLGASGVMLWGETLFMMLFPKWVIDLNHVIHSFEATLGFLVLVVWHLYNVHLNPRVFPMNKVWLTGKISKEELKRDHQLEYERLFGNE
jgi:formate dehydrogenase subunit gamma